MPTPQLIYEDGTPLFPGDLYKSWSNHPRTLHIMLLSIGQKTAPNHPYGAGHVMSEWCVMDIMTGHVWKFSESQNVIVLRLS